MPFQSVFRSSVSMCLVTLLSTSIKSCAVGFSLLAIHSGEQMILLTETKKLVVPSDLVKSFGNNFSQVSSPYIASLLSFLRLNCKGQESWSARVDDVSDSAKLSMTSKKDGIEPVVIAFTRGMVIVGEVACAVNGTAAPERMSLARSN